MAKLNIETIPLGLIETNCYLVWPEAESVCWIIDPGGDPTPVVEIMAAKALRLEKIVITHGHFDHFLGTRELKAQFPTVPIAIHASDAAVMPDAKLNMSALFLGRGISCPPADEYLQDGQELKLGTLTFQVIHTPGHAPGGICLYCPECDPKVLFAGDLIFAGGGVGRTDFPRSSTEQLWESIAKIFRMVPEATTVYSGHGPTTTIGEEKEYLGRNQL